MNNNKKSQPDFIIVLLVVFGLGLITTAFAGMNQTGSESSALILSDAPEPLAESQ